MCPRDNHVPDPGKNQQENVEAAPPGQRRPIEEQGIASPGTVPQGTRGEEAPSSATDQPPRQVQVKSRAPQNCPDQQQGSRHPTTRAKPLPSPAPHRGANYHSRATGDTPAARLTLISDRSPPIQSPRVSDRGHRRPEVRKSPDHQARRAREMEKPRTDAGTQHNREPTTPSEQRTHNTSPTTHPD